MTEWIKSFVGYLLITGIAAQMLPGKKYEPYVRLFFGFLMIVLVLQPILKIGDANDYVQRKVSEFVREQELLEEQIFVQGENFRLESESLQDKTGEEIKINEIEPVRVEVTIDD